MSAIKNVTVTGAAGSLGEVVLNKLISSGKFNIQVLRRNGSKSTFPSDVKVVDVDFESLDSLKAALTGQDAVVSTVGAPGVLGQTLLFDAAAAAGVKRVLPSEFGSDLDQPSNRSLPVYGHKVQVQEHLIKLAQTTDLTYTFVYNNGFLDWGLEHKFLIDLSEYKPRIFDDGEAIFTATTLDSVALAVIGVLEHLDETKNRSVRIEDTKISQNKILALAKEAAPEKPWAPNYVSLADYVAGGFARLKEGKFDIDVILPLLAKAVFDPASGPNFTKTDNELLGLKGKTDQEVAEIVKKYVK
jgi:nucleoside-diphosphate-sugar epimerase